MESEQPSTAQYPLDVGGYLRELRPEEGKTIAEMISADKKYFRFIGKRALRDFSDPDVLEREIRGGDNLHLGIFDEQDRLIGEVTFTPSPRQSASFGIVVSPNAKKGAGSSATKAAINFGFDVLHLEKIVAAVDEENARAIEMFNNLGFSKGGRVGHILSFSILKADVNT